MSRFRIRFISDLKEKYEIIRFNLANSLSALSIVYSAFAVCGSVASVSRLAPQVPPSTTEEFNDNFIPPIGDLRFTPYQIEVARKLGLDVKKWPIDPNANPSRDAWFEDSPWNKLWSNPEGYQGTNLRIPYRFQPGAFTPDMVKDITLWLEELGGYVNGCIEFYND